ncbi:MAG TPA: ATP-binding cassette domain-containing protein [Segetibacter sp.]
MIQLEQVSKSYKNVKAVDDISLDIREGETVVLLGTSGCGKTTTLRMVNRLTDATAGSIKVNGTDIKNQSPEQLRRGIGYVLQHHGLFPHYTVAENIAIVPQLLKWDKTKIASRISELLEKLRLPANIAGMFPASLSGGQQQRVGLARALAADPPVLLMDEPFGALDTVTRSQVRKEFGTLDELKRKTILMVTHDVREAIELGDLICVMDKGKIVQAGAAKELLFSPVNDFVSSFLQEDRLRFELETTSIKDVWQFLPPLTHSTEGIELPIDEDLWRTIELMSLQSLQPNTQYVSILNAETKVIDTASLMAAFSQSKNSYING